MVYVGIGDAQGLPPGLYLYQPSDHELVECADGENRAALAKAN